MVRDMNLTNDITRPPPGLLAEDDAIAVLVDWHGLGRKCALVTIVGIEGGSPRSVGAQMVIAEDGRFHGYLSGGCLEQAIVLEAQAILTSGTNRIVRYGKGSPYFDVKLPCGSGLDIYFDVRLDGALIDAMGTLHDARTPFALKTDLATGTSVLVPMPGADASAASAREGEFFSRLYLPLPRLVLIGSGPAVGALARLSVAAGMETAIWAGDDATRESLDRSGIDHLKTPSPPESLMFSIDPFTAVVLAFHEHDLEPVILAQVLRAPGFYIGVLGNHAVHRRRLEQLRDMGFSDTELARIRAPVGSIPQAKGKATLGFGVLAEVMAEAKARSLVA